MFHLIYELLASELQRCQIGLRLGVKVRADTVLFELHQVGSQILVLGSYLVKEFLVIILLILQFLALKFRRVIIHRRSMVAVLSCSLGS